MSKPIMPSKNLVKHWMKTEPVTISKDATYFEALKLMYEGHFRRLPVEHYGSLVGMITDRDLKEASPSDALDMRSEELNKLLTGISAADIMTKPVFTVQIDDAIETAAIMMNQHKISGLPVLHNGKIVGIITTTNILEAFIELLNLSQDKRLSNILFTEVF